MSDPAPLDALPLDVLVCITSLAPILARLRTLSFVSKRWRIACLRSIRHLRFAASNPTERAARFASAVSLLPSLASLNLSDLNLCVTPPTSITELHVKLAGRAGLSLVHLEAEGQPNVFSSYLPRLTKLNVELRRDPQDKATETLVWPLLARHLSALTSLKLDQFIDKTSNLITQLANAPLPQMRDLTLQSWSCTHQLLARILSNAPKLQSLRLICGISLADLCTIQGNLLAPLRVLTLSPHCSLRRTQEQIQFLEALPNLRTIITGSFPLPPSLRFRLSPLGVSATLAPDDIPRYRHALRLQIKACAPPVAPLPPLPPYKVVETARAPPAIAVAWALAIISAAHSVRHLDVALSTLPPDALRTAITQLVEASVQHCVRELTVRAIVSGGTLSEKGKALSAWAAMEAIQRLCFPVVERGWLKLTMHVRPE